MPSVVDSHGRSLATLLPRPRGIVRPAFPSQGRGSCRHSRRRRLDIPYGNDSPRSRLPGPAAAWTAGAAVRPSYKALVDDPEAGLSDDQSKEIGEDSLLAIRAQPFRFPPFGCSAFPRIASAASSSIRRTQSVSLRRSFAAHSSRRARCSSEHRMLI